VFVRSLSDILNLGRTPQLFALPVDILPTMLRLRSAQTHRRGTHRVRLMSACSGSGTVPSGPTDMRVLIEGLIELSNERCDLPCDTSRGSTIGAGSREDAMILVDTIGGDRVLPRACAVLPMPSNETLEANEAALCGPVITAQLVLVEPHRQSYHRLGL